MEVAHIQPCQFANPVYLTASSVIENVIPIEIDLLCVACSQAEMSIFVYYKKRPLSDDDNVKEIPRLKYLEPVNTNDADMR